MRKKDAPRLACTGHYFLFYRTDPGTLVSIRAYFDGRLLLSRVHPNYHETRSNESLSRENFSITDIPNSISNLLEKYFYESPSRVSLVLLEIT